MRHFLFSLISLIIAIFFVVLGLIGVFIPWSENIRTRLIEFITNDALAISLFGFTFLVIALSIISNIFINARRSHYYLKSGNYDITIDEDVIQQYLNEYWKKTFPENEISSQLKLRNNQIYISVDLPYQPIETQKTILERVKNDLQQQFVSYLGYQKEFFLTASFLPISKS